MSNITPFLNPIEWVKAYSYHKKSARFDKSSYDLELYLYSKILTNNMLHYGYFEDVNVKPETISLKQVEDAQIRYAENIINQIIQKELPILDVGCGMGGLGEMMYKAGCTKLELLTPNKNQIDFIKKTYPQFTTHRCKFENYPATEQKFGTVINSESLQYIKLEDAFDRLEKILLPDGRWIIVDYFRLNNEGISKSAHILDDFKSKVKEYNWQIFYEQDITANVLPTLRFAYMYIERFLLPVKHFAFEKLRFKKAWLYYLTGRIRETVDRKIAKEGASIDPVKFEKEKKYVLFVLEKKR